MTSESESESERASELISQELRSTPVVAGRVAIIVLGVLTVAVAFVAVALAFVLFNVINDNSALRKEASCRAAYSVDLGVTQAHALSLKMDLDASTARALLYSSQGNHDAFNNEVKDYAALTNELDAANTQFRAAADTYSKQLDVCRH